MSQSVRSDSRMQPRVDVWLAGQTAGDLRPPPRSIIDGGEAVSVMRTRCLGRIGLSRLAVSVTVDAATAKRIILTCRLENVWRSKAVPAVLVAAALIVVAYIVDLVRNDEQHLGMLFLIALILAFASLTGRIALNLLHSRHHPKEAGGNIYIRGVDRGVAEVWANLNPEGAIKLIDG